MFNMTGSFINVLVCVDLENKAGYCDRLGVPFDMAPVMDKIAEMSDSKRPALAQSFGDIVALPLHHSKFKIRENLYLNQIQHIDCPHLRGSKNSADIKLAVEVISMMYDYPHLTHFVIDSHDRDFIPVAQKIREKGKIAIGVGPSRSMVSQEYTRAFDFFLFHDELVEVPETTISEPSPVEPSPSDAKVKKDVPPLLDVSHLIAAIRGVAGAGHSARACEVATQMKLLFPDLDVKKEFGTFKGFCREQVKTGMVELDDHDEANFIIKISTPDSSSEATEQNDFPVLLDSTDSDATPIDNARPMQALSLEKPYRDWVLQKLKIVMPTQAERIQLYEQLVATLHDQFNGEPIPLKTITNTVAASMPGRDRVPFSLDYGLFRGGALNCVENGNKFNPGVIGIRVPLEKLDHYFVVNTLNVFRKDRTDLPFDASVWSRLMYGDISGASTLSAIEEISEPNHSLNSPDMDIEPIGTADPAELESPVEAITI